MKILINLTKLIVSLQNYLKKLFTLRNKDSVENNINMQQAIFF